MRVSVDYSVDAGSTIYPETRADTRSARVPLSSVCQGAWLDPATLASGVSPLLRLAPTEDIAT